MDSLNKKTNKDQETLILMAKIADYDKAFDYYKSEIEREKKREINRINKEFLTNDYQRRYKIDQHALVSAIYGEDNMSSEYSRMMREQKVNKNNNFYIS